jgi:hypothetical protein
MLCLKIPPPMNTVNAFADDLTIVALNVLGALRILHPCFDTLARAAGLHLNAKKCLIIPLAQASDFRIRCFLVDHIPAWIGMLLADTGKLLGVFIGPAAEESRWADCLNKYWARGRDAKATGGGFWHALHYYKIFAASVLSHIMQFNKLPATFHKMESLALQGLTRGPHQVFPGDTLCHLTDIGARTEAPPLGLINIAAMVRTATSSAAFFRAKDTLATDDLPDDAFLHPRRVPWEDGACITALIDAFNYVYSIPVAIDTFEPHRFQAQLTAALRATCSTPWPALLRRRLLRWVNEVTQQDIATVIHNLKVAFCMLPASVVFDSLRFILNGLLTARRIGGSSSDCIFCGWTGGDAVEHLAHCPAFGPATRSLFPRLAQWEGPIRRPVALCLLIASDPTLVHEAVLFGAGLYYVHNMFRHGHCACPGDLLRARIRDLRTRHRLPDMHVLT